MHKKTVLLHIGVFLGLLLLLWSSLILSAAIPNSAIRANMEKSALSYKTSEAFQLQGSRLGSVADNYADSILLNVTWNMGRGNPFRSSLDTLYYMDSDYGENASLYISVMDSPAPNTDYARYWHGSASLLRPLHLLTDVGRIKLLGFILTLLLAAITCAILIKRSHLGFAVALAISLCAVELWNIRLSLEYQSVFLITFLLCPLFLMLERRGDVFLTLLAVVSGTATAFFDFLTCETLPILLPLVLVISVRAKESRLGSFKSSLFLLIKCGIAWLLAYGGTFFMKWLLATLVTGENKFLSALSSAGVRVFGDTSSQGVANPILRIPAALLANLTVLFGGTTRLDIPRVIIGILISAAALGSVLYLFHRKHTFHCALKLLALLGSVVFLRYLILANHSYLHEFFTYRALATPICALLCGICLCIQRPKEKRKLK